MRERVFDIEERGGGTVLAGMRGDGESGEVSTAKWTKRKGQAVITQG
jgi:hypothetical protein